MPRSLYADFFGVSEYEAQESLRYIHDKKKNDELQETIKKGNYASFLPIHHQLKEKFKSFCSKGCLPDPLLQGIEKNGINYNIGCEWLQMTYLWYAVEVGCSPTSNGKEISGSIKLCRWLLSQGADPSLYGLSAAIFIATKENNPLFLRLLLPYAKPENMNKTFDRGLVKDSSLLHAAVQNMELEDIMLLVAHGANIATADNLCAAAILRGRLDILIYLIKNGAYITSCVLKNIFTDAISTITHPISDQSLNLFKLLKPMVANCNHIPHNIDLKYESIKKNSEDSEWRDYYKWDDNCIARVQKNLDAIKTILQGPSLRYDYLTQTQLYLLFTKNIFTLIAPFRKNILILFLTNNLRILTNEEPEKVIAKDLRLKENTPRYQYTPPPRLPPEMLGLILLHTLPYIFEGKMVRPYFKSEFISKEGPVKRTHITEIQAKSIQITRAFFV